MMRIWILKGLVILFAVGQCFTQSAMPTTLHADRVVVVKKARTLQLLSRGKVIKTYKVALGGNPVGPKTRQGDHKTPEGV